MAEPDVSVPARVLDEAAVWVLAQQYWPVFKHNNWTWQGNVPTVQAIADRIQWMWRAMVQANSTRMEYGRLETTYDARAQRAVVRLIVDETTIATKEKPS